MRQLSTVQARWLAAAVATAVLLACQCTDTVRNERRAQTLGIDSPGILQNKIPKSLRLRDLKPNKVLTKFLRIRGGNQTDTVNFPYAAAIFVNDVFWCAGAIVDVNWVLTAAHCLNYVLHVSPLKTLKDVVKVRVGSHMSGEGGQQVSVVGAIRHPKFEEEPAPHADIALLKLDSDLKFNNHVNLIKIYEGMKEPFAQTFVTITGWGATNGSATAFNEASPFLLTARLKVRTHGYCVDSYQQVNNLEFTEDFFCASLRNGSRDACLFDAGAPAVQNNRLVGVMSFGPERCESPQPAVFTKAFYFRDFVKTTISSYKTPADLIQAMAELEEDEKKEENKEEGNQEAGQGENQEPGKEDANPPAAE